VSIMLELKNIETYYGPIMGIRGVSLEVHKGQIVALLGANGAGKTTVLKTISGAMDAQKGKVLLGGQAIQGLDPDVIARLGVAHVPEGREVFPFLSVEENLKVGAFSRKGANIVAELDTVYGYFPSLLEKRNAAAGYLSGGQQQMLAIGRALMLRPDIMLLDEPSLGLSPLLVKENFKVIQRVNELGVTVLLVEQNVRQTLAIAHQGYVLSKGRIAAHGNADRLRDNEEVRAAYFGS